MIKNLLTATLDWKAYDNWRSTGPRNSGGAYRPRFIQLMKGISGTPQHIPATAKKASFTHGWSGRRPAIAAAARA